MRKIIFLVSAFLNVVLVVSIFWVIEDKKAIEDTFIAKIKSCDPTYFDQQK